MNVLIDTSVWSLALRRSKDKLSAKQVKIIQQWRSLVENGNGVIAGPIRQEILSGIHSQDQFRLIQTHLEGFDCPSLSNDDFDQAAIFYNHIRSKGIAGGSMDLLICSIAYRNNLLIFTTDHDFDRYAKYLPIELFRFNV